MIRMIERALGLQRVTVREDQRAIVLRKGRLAGVLGAGQHKIRARAEDLIVETHDLSRPDFASAYDNAL